PATRPAASTQLSATPQAQAELEKIKAAYVGLNSLDVAGKITAHFGVAGQKQNQESEFTSIYLAPNKFRQQVKGDVVAGSTGEKLYLFSSDDNKYLTQDAPKGKVKPGEMPQPYDKIVGTQNLSLMLALSTDPTRVLTANLTDAKHL